MTLIQELHDDLYNQMNIYARHKGWSFPINDDQYEEFSQYYFRHGIPELTDCQELEGLLYDPYYPIVGY